MQITTDGKIEPCEAYTELWNMKKTEAQAWSGILWAVGVATAAALIVALWSATQGESVTAIVSGAGVVVGGFATGWLLKRRNQMMKEIEDYLKEVKKYCGSVPG